MKLLILGGTADARNMTAELIKYKNLSLIYSIAGLVRTAKLDCPVIHGGFSQFGGLAHYIKAQKIQTIIDATHPYAQQMSNTAVTTARQLNIPCWRYTRPAWQPKEGDNWSIFNHFEELLTAVTSKKSLLLSAGQLTQHQINQLAQNSGQKQLLRTAAPTKGILPTSMTWIKAIGPFSLENERELMSKHQIDAIISKNSGGEATYAKIIAAREQSIPIYMHQRPALIPADLEFSCITSCIEEIIRNR